MLNQSLKHVYIVIQYQTLIPVPFLHIISIHKLQTLSTSKGILYAYDIRLKDSEWCREPS